MIYSKKAICVALACCCLSGTAFAQHISLSMSNVTVKQAIDAFNKKSGYSFVFSSKDVDTKKKVSISADNQEIEEVVRQILDGQSVTYEIKGKNIVVRSTTSTVPIGQKKTVKGQVVDAAGIPVIGANIVAKGTTNGTITDMDGNFSLEVTEGTILTVSYIGFANQEIKVGNSNNLSIVLKEDSQALDELVVTALGIKRSEKGLGYASQKLDGEKVNVVKNVDAASGLIGKISGLKVSSSTEFNVAPTMSLRGESPLLVIDGVPYTNVSLRDIATDDIESMNVLKGATASALYGSRGGSGAIIVTTKKGNKKGGLSVSVNSSTMFNAGFVALPEVQTGYSSGTAGKYAAGDYVWGDKLDIGRTALQYNPYTYEWEESELVSKGKNNLKNFLETGLVTNNNISVSHQGEKGNFRTSLTHVYNKGQYPNNKLNKITFSLGGNINIDKFSFEGSIIYNKRFYPNNTGTGYGKGGYLYNLLIWT